MLMSAEAYRESLRQYSPRVFVNGDLVDSVADEDRFMPGINAIGVTYDFALAERSRLLMAPTEARTGKTVNRFLHMNTSTTDLLHKLEACAVRLGSHSLQARDALQCGSFARRWHGART